MARVAHSSRPRGQVLTRPRAIAVAVHAKSAESAAELIAMIYTILTQREVKVAKYNDLDAADPGNDPAYTRMNASSLLASNMKESEMATTLLDHTTASARAKSLIDDHTDAQRAARELEPGRYALPPGGTASQMSMQRILRGPPKPVPQEIESTQVRFQEVKVTAVDRNIAQMRAARDSALAGGNSYASSTNAPVASMPTGGMMGGPIGGPPPPGPGSIDVGRLLSERALPLCPDAVSYLGAAGPDAFAALVSSLSLLPISAVQSLFAAAAEGAAEPLGDACMQEPSNAWHLFAMLAPALAAADAPEAYTAIVDFLRAFAEVLAQNDAGMPVLTGFVLPHLLPLLRSAPPRKATQLLSIVYAFSPPTPEAHIAVIQIGRASCRERV